MQIKEINSFLFIVSPIISKYVLRYIIFSLLFICSICACSVSTDGQKKKNTPIYFNTNYPREIKLVPIII